MTPYVLSLFPREDIDIFWQIKRLVDRLPDVDLGKDESGESVVLSCHILCRAIARLFELKVEDGLFADIFNHSWLVTNCGNVIDPYPVGILGGPIIVEGCDPFDTFSPARRLYRPKSTYCILHGRSQKSSFRRSVRRVRRAMQAIIGSGQIKTY